MYQYLNSYPEWRNIPSAPNNHFRFFFLHTLPSSIIFKLWHALFYQFYAEISIFSIKNCSIRLLFTSCRSSYTPWYKTEISSTGENRGKTCRVCKKRISIQCENHGFLYLDTNVNKASDQDSISPRLLREGAFILAHPLSILFNRSLTQIHFPSSWKDAYLTPIDKKNKTSQPNNYTPISLLSPIGN